MIPPREGDKVIPARRQPGDKVNRMAEIEEQLRERTGHTDHAR
jgi:hypothetical protein